VNTGNQSSSWRSLTLLIATLVFLAASARGQEMLLVQRYTSGGTPPAWVDTKATFDASGLTGVGEEIVPLDTFTLLFNFRGYTQAACIVPTLPPYPEGTLAARFQNGVFDSLFSVSYGGGAQMQIKPPSNWLGEAIVLGSNQLIDRPCCAGFGRYILTTSSGPCPRVLPSATLRNAGSNPLSYSATAPTLGSSWTATVDLTTTGHDFAQLRGFSVPATTTLGGGQVLLGGGPVVFQLPARAGPTAAWEVPIPNDCAVVGLAFPTQAVHFGGPTPFALSNAEDLVVGY